MAMFAQLWEYWHARQYEEAASEVCRLVGVEEEAFSSQRQLLTAAGAVHASECPAWSEEDRSVALLGRNCCNRLAERSLRNSNWPEAARWCALAWRLEGGQSCASLWLEDGSWAAARYQRLFHAAEVFRLACKGRGQKASKKAAKAEEGGFDGSEYLQASRRCLETCEAILQRWPTCTANPEGIYTCLAEICWQLKDIAAVRWSCRQASGGECFYAECDADRPPRTGWRNYSDAEVELVLEGGWVDGEAKKDSRSDRSRSPRREKCPW
ncbi:unnamed protein product [Symbiodinium sp. CCMP2592]|nr:unnamed protein product [Symbiodinium sp. CCMP2592]